MKGIFQLLARSAGKKADGSVDLSSTSLSDRYAHPPRPKIRLYNSVYTTPLSVYIDITADDKLENLIITGSPTRQQLEEAKMKIVSEFQEISSCGETKAYLDAAGSYYSKLNVITGFEVAIRLLRAGRYEKAIDYLNRNGVKCSAPNNDEEILALIAAIELKLKNRLAKFQEASSKFKALSKKGEKPTRAYYNKLLVMLSTCEIIKMQLNPKNMTVAEFAEYLNVYNEYQNQLKIRKYGKR